MAKWHGRDRRWLSLCSNNLLWKQVSILLKSCWGLLFSPDRNSAGITNRIGVKIIWIPDFSNGWVNFLLHWMMHNKCKLTNATLPRPVKKLQIGPLHEVLEQAYRQTVARCMACWIFLIQPIEYWFKIVQIIAKTDKKGWPTTQLPLKLNVIWIYFSFYS